MSRHFKVISAIVFIIALGSSCSFFINKILDNEKPVFGPKLSLLFSHNISGETHPCGCRQFPLGGLPQIAGLFHEIKSQNDVLYIDSGDTFFPSSVIPKYVEQSLSYTAKQLAKKLDELGLAYITPGDQDFAMGVEFLNQIALENKFEFIIANLKKDVPLKHKEWVTIKRGKNLIFLAGFIHSETMRPEYESLFLPIENELSRVLLEMKAQGYDEKNPDHRLIVISHSGIDQDEKLAEKFPQIDWIIGSHSQSFLRYSRDVGKTKIVQVLSKNHYIGEVSVSMAGKSSDDTYRIIEIREELSKKLEPNPYKEFIDRHKATVALIQEKEQETTFTKSDNSAHIRTSAQCMTCHQPQHQFWQGTAHANAFHTLIQNNESKNLTCIKCHSLGMNQPGGFTNSKDIVQGPDAINPQYWKQVFEMSKGKGSIRKMDSESRRKLAMATDELDKKSNLTHNFSGVQCLNCHTQNPDHPLSTSTQTKTERLSSIKQQCLSCHTPEQSPEWQQNPSLIDEKIKEIACPRL